MITKSEWHEWKQHKITQKFVEVIKDGRGAAVEELLANRKTVGDFQRGAVNAIDEIIDVILKGDYLYTEVDA